MSGWPADVPLPVDPQWKSDYAASVRRLVRDGVDTPLANLFVHAAPALTPDAEGVNRARSATEAFLYRRLETLPETAGFFRLNAELPIPFDGWGQIEVDLLCAEARVDATRCQVERWNVCQAGQAGGREHCRFSLCTDHLDHGTQSEYMN